MQTVDEAHLLVPTKPDVHKKDISFQVHPNRLTLKVKGESLLSGDLPEAVNIDGMTLGTRAGGKALAVQASVVSSVVLVQVPSGYLKTHVRGAWCTSSWRSRSWVMKAGPRP